MKYLDFKEEPMKEVTIEIDFSKFGKFVMKQVRRIDRGILTLLICWAVLCSIFFLSPLLLGWM
jgi:TM2 domain-containing membrane protein YozV